MASITSAGIGSGIDVESLITRLVALERKPIEQLKQSTDGLKTQLSAIGKLQSSVATLRDLAGKLSHSGGFNTNTASSSDPNYVTATADSTATAGSYKVQVSALAQAQVTTGPAISDAVGTGDIVIEFGTYSADLGTFTVDALRNPLIVPAVVGDGVGKAALESIRDKINNLNGGIVASVVTDVTGSRLVMRASEGGAANGFRVRAQGDGDGNDSDAVGLSRLAYDPSTNVNPSNRAQNAQDASVVVDGVPILSASNRVEGALTGVVLNLSKVDGAGHNEGTTITIGQDKTATKKLVTDFVTAYNDTIKQLRDLTRNDPNGTLGPLKGDQTINSIQFQLRQLVGSSTTQAGLFSRLADIGLDPGSDGLIKVSESKLDAALNNTADLEKLFAAVNADNASDSGFGVRLRSLADQLLSTDGRIEARKKGINSRIDAAGDRTDALERRVSLVEKRLRAQYTSLDSTVGKLNGLSTYLQQQLGRL